MIERVATLVVLSTATWLLGPGRADAQQNSSEPAARTDRFGIGATQLALRLARGNEEARFRATVLAKHPAALVVLTAGHCLRPDDARARIEVRCAGGSMAGHVVRVVPNPYYHPDREEIPGADNAVAVIAVDLDEGSAADAFDGLKSAELTARPLPAAGGQTVPVHTIDQHDAAHAFRAGNYSNPRWLEWGPAYRPIEGDSGSGVFVLRVDPDGSPRPVLIGTVVVRSDRGGGASLVDRRFTWIEPLLRPAPGGK